MWRRKPSWSEKEKETEKRLKDCIKEDLKEEKLAEIEAKNRMAGKKEFVFLTAASYFTEHEWKNKKRKYFLWGDSLLFFIIFSL